MVDHVPALGFEQLEAAESWEGRARFRDCAVGAVEMMLRRDSQALDLSAFGIVSRHAYYAGNVLVTVPVGSCE